MINETEFRLADGTDTRTLPKVLLHDHLDGGLRPQTIIDLANGAELPASDAEALGQWFEDSANSGSLEQYLETFAVVLSVMQTADALRRVAREAIEDLDADGVIYAELRWAPEQHLRDGLTLDGAIEAVTAGLREGCEAADGRIRVGQLICVMRQNDNAVAVVEAALRHRSASITDARVVGVDLAGPEAGFPPSGHREAFALAAREFMPATVHAGEGDGVDSIASAILDGRALRLGHGVRIADDIEIAEQVDGHTTVALGRVANWVRDRELTLEVSPSSNLQTGIAEDMRDHPFDLLYQLGFDVTVNTDNRLMSATTPSLELVRLSDAFGYSLDDLEEFAMNAAAAAFLPQEDRTDLAERIEAGFQDARG
ncbi:adenosine deaminase [Gulosibacter bifidus]|uniref:adenosine deaminase n=1 Tax=Gulosibacter bifidus TaxID=272239 RepID=A0ABW5RIX8_9MICO|nr:adenosine deaminase [Gulosibacter bifidus]